MPPKLADRLAQLGRDSIARQEAICRILWRAGPMRDAIADGGRLPEWPAAGIERCAAQVVETRIAALTLLDLDVDDRVTLFSLLAEQAAAERAYAAAADNREGRP